MLPNLRPLSGLHLTTIKEGFYISQDKDKDKEYRPFVKVPNKIIKYSCLHNHFVLALYLYSAINRKYYNNVVDTNIYHITKTFDSTPDKRYSKESTFYKTLLQLNDDVLITDEEGNSSLEFSACWDIFSPITIKKKRIDYSDRIQYEFQDTGSVIADNFTIMYYDEYEYLLNYLNQKNEEIMTLKESTGKGKKKNIVDILNFYMYMKYIITLSNNMKHTAHPTIKTLSEKLKLGKNTITEYTNLLIDMKMLNCSKGDFYNKISNIYTLSDEWKLL